MELKTIERVAIKVINVLSENEVRTEDVDHVFDTAKRIISLETEVKELKFPLF